MPDKADAATRPPGPIAPARADAIVVDGQAQFPANQREGDGDLAGVGVAVDVGQRLLADPEQRQREFVGDPVGAPIDMRLDREAGAGRESGGEVSTASPRPWLWSNGGWSRKVWTLISRFAS